MLYNLIKGKNSIEIDFIATMMSAFSETLKKARRQRELKRWRGMTRADLRLEENFLSALEALNKYK